MPGFQQGASPWGTPGTRADTNERPFDCQLHHICGDWACRLLVALHTCGKIASPLLLHPH